MKFKDKPKKEGAKKESKASLTTKVSQKKSLKSKSTTRRIETIVLPNLEDEDSSWKKKLMETMIVHRDRSVEDSGERKPELVSHFRVWEEY
jgi:hypothetical protein